MMNASTNWDLDNVPATFWKLIARAKPDPAVFRAALYGMTREELGELYHQYRGLAYTLLTEEHLAKLGKVSEDQANDLAFWVVGEGEEYYRRVHANPDQPRCAVRPKVWIWPR